MNNYIRNTIILACVVLFTSCLATHTKENNNKVPNYPITARITFYTGQKERVAYTGKHAIEGVSVAAHPKYKFNTKIYIPTLSGIIGDGVYTVQDRGSAVTKRKASHGKTDVFDIYIRSNSKFKQLAYNIPEYMSVYILN